MIIFLTGAAGLLGGAIAHELVRRGHGVIGLVHNAADIRGNDGGALQASSFDGDPPQDGEILTLRGDIAEPGLGLSESERMAVAQGVDCVIHCAALVRFEAPSEDLESINVHGTCNVAKQFPNARLVHVSTAYSCGLRKGAISETSHGPNDSFGNGYERSKALAEHRLLELRPDAIIARPSIIVGEHKSGQIRSFDTVYTAFKFIAEGRVKSVRVDPRSTLNFVPIDHVVEGIVALACDTNAQSEIVHLAAREAISSELFLSLIGRTPGLRAPQIAAPCVEANGLAGMTERLIQPYLSYFERSPQFETNAITRLVGLKAPQLDAQDLLKHISFCVDEGFIKPRQATN
ncbi:SDR family oxidoreductase [uncultured Erythrobacter sp.]|uniref:SDR family oxidoreductase n=1 Tax=uncultured Erythrobacter sp. TaxID=263913 RepID=UPI00262D0947|nr:SDR family oxidoreductase [uncultured Erythrobacter sp.]